MVALYVMAVYPYGGYRDLEDRPFNIDEFVEGFNLGKNCEIWGGEFQGYRVMNRYRDECSWFPTLPKFKEYLFYVDVLEMG